MDSNMEWSNAAWEAVAAKAPGPKSTSGEVDQDTEAVTKGAETDLVCSSKTSTGDLSGRFPKESWIATFLLGDPD